MKINPDSPDFQRQIDSATTPSKTGKAFYETLASKSQPNVATSNAQALAAAVQGISKHDLTDPVKANAAIDRAVQEMMEREFGGMCTADREHVAAWLRSDPMMRSALLQGLMSVAN
ncbi:MAG: hypothetical protein JO033_19925 [Acidobacteriaceae bacterium]|nr:hypothetical protein [Acidobacteriaceae bacterium]MBV9498300.1 hypothetical protein [Acidobacteriaceae bacterium]